MLKTILAGLLASALVVGGPPSTAHAEDVYGDVDTQQPPTPVRVLPQKCTGDQVMPTQARQCRVTRYRSRPTVIVWGDSHAWQQTPALIAQARATRTNLLVFEMGACPPMDLRGTGHGGQCARQGALALRTIKRKARHGPVTVVLGGAWSLYTDLLARMDGGWAPTGGDASLARQALLWEVGAPRAFRTLEKWRRVRTVGMAQMPMRPAAETPVEVKPTDPDQPPGAARTAAIPYESQVSRWLARNVDRVADSTRYVCDTTWCRTTVDGLPTWLDDLHVNPAIAPGFAPAYARFFRR